jgi:hypothetical protein
MVQTMVPTGLNQVGTISGWNRDDLNHNGLNRAGTMNGLNHSLNHKPQWFKPQFKLHS